MLYREELDGLRGLSVILVVLFHAGFEWFAGGFVGVDIFFVISGFLITSLILNGLNKGEFSLTDFYQRRARRLLPALFLVMFISLPFAYLWLGSEDLTAFSLSLISTVTFSSNIFFWTEVGYFDNSIELNPLLHTWSLAIEEQFYLLFPYFLMCSMPFGMRITVYLIVFFLILSFGLAQWAAYNAPAAGFYLLPTRGWEILMGALSAFYLTSNGDATNVRKNQYLSFLGLCLIFIAVGTFNQTTPFPSVYTLIPVFGAVLLITCARPGTFIYSIFAWKPLVFVGLCSYSFYLWHQPVFAFARARLIVEPGLAVNLCLIALSFILAVLTYKLVEQPFRQNLISKRILIVFTIVGTLFFSVLGFAGYFFEGFPKRSQISDIAEKFEPAYGLSINCANVTGEMYGNDQQLEVRPECRSGNSPAFFVWGDSYAMPLVAGMLAADPKIQLQQHTFPSCAPILGLSYFDQTNDSFAKNCISFNNNGLTWLRENTSVQYVILSSAFDKILARPLLTAGEQDVIESSYKLVSENLVKTIDSIRALGMEPIIVSPPPPVSEGLDLGHCLFKSLYFSAHAKHCDYTLELNHYPLEMLRSIESKVAIYWLHNNLCADDICNPKQEGVPLFRDNGHLSNTGGEYLGKKYSWGAGFYEKTKTAD